MLSISKSFLDEALKEYQTSKKRNLNFGFDENHSRQDTLEILKDLESEGYVSDINAYFDSSYGGAYFTLTLKAISLVE